MKTAIARYLHPVSLGLTTLAALISVVTPTEAQQAGGWPSKQQFEQMVEMMQPDDHAPLETGLRAVYSLIHPPRSVSKKDVQRAIRGFARSLRLKPSGSTVQVIADPFHLPNLETARLRLRWKSATAGSRSNLLARSGKSTAAAFAPLANPLSLNPTNVRVAELALEKAPNDSSQLTARGELALRVAARFEHFHFSCNKATSHARKAGPRTKSGISVTLRQCQRDAVEAEVVGTDAKTPLAIVARDADGRRLKPRQTDRRPILAEGKDLGSVDYESLDKNIPFRRFVTAYFARHTVATTHRARFHGVVRSVDVWVPTRWVESSQRVRIGTCRKQAKRYARHCTRYVPAAQTPRFGSLTVNGVESQTRVVPTRSPSAMGGGKPELTLLLPRLPHTAFAKLKHADAKIYDSGGGGLAAKTSESGLIADEDRFTLYVDQTSSAKPSRIAGSFSVAYPLRVQSVRLTRKRPHLDGLTARFDGDNRVKIEVKDEGTAKRLLPERSFAFDKPAWQSIRGYDTRGRLVRLQRSDLGSSAEPTLSLRFAGTVIEVEVLQVTKWHQFRVEYDGPIAPPIAEGYLGDSAARYTAGLE
jgi:hypothetical protein